MPAAFAMNYFFHANFLYSIGLKHRRSRQFSYPVRPKGPFYPLMAYIAAEHFACHYIIQIAVNYANTHNKMLVTGSDQLNSKEVT